MGATNSLSCNWTRKNFNREELPKAPIHPWNLPDKTHWHTRWMEWVVKQKYIKTVKQHMLPTIAELLSNLWIPGKYTFTSINPKSISNSIDSDYSSLCSYIVKSIPSEISEEQSAHIPTDIRFNSESPTGNKWNHLQILEQ